MYFELLVLIGSKCDTRNPATCEKLQEWAEEKGIVYLETSALTGENVEEVIIFMWWCYKEKSERLIELRREEIGR